MDAGSREEYRKFLRFPLSLEAECIYNVGEKAARCRVVDISSQGLGLELDTPVGMQSGQLMLLEIDIADQKPLSAITKLAWVQSQEDGFMTQRAGSYLLFMDPAGQDKLMEYAYAGLISNATKHGTGSLT
jgi:hypothetical protein